MLKKAAFALAVAASAVAHADSMECQKAKRELSISNNIQSLSPADKRTRINLAISQVNAACGTKTPLVEEKKRDWMACTGTGTTMICQ